MKKKILFLSPLPPPSYGSAMSSEMCLGILKRNKEFDVRNIKINSSGNVNGLRIISLGKIFFTLKKMKEIKDAIKEFDPDLVYFMPATSQIGLIRDFLFFLIIGKYKERLVYHIRTRVSDEDKDNLFKKIIYSKMFVGSKMIVLDELLENDVEKYFKPKEIFILSNAIKNSLSDAKLKKIISERRGNSRFEILFLSNMYESKGWLLLLQACVLLKKYSDDFVCNFIGGWPSDDEKERFFDFVKENGLEKNVKYFGVLSGKRKNSVYVKANVFVFPTYYELEAHPRVIIEAMMYGLPIIANSHASIPTTIQDKKTGLLLKENSPEEIEKYLWLIKKSKKMGSKIGLAGRKRFLKNYEIKKYEKKFINIIREV